jgi:hypothetical protein
MTAQAQKPRSCLSRPSDHPRTTDLHHGHRELDVVADLNGGLGHDAHEPVTAKSQPEELRILRFAADSGISVDGSDDDDDDDDEEMQGDDGGDNDDGGGGGNGVTVASNEADS